MKYYRDEHDEIYAYELDGSQDNFISSKAPLTEEELRNILPTNMDEIDINTIIEAHMTATQ